MKSIDIGIPRGARLMMGVSLRRQIFSVNFTRNLLSVAVERGVRELVVVLFDEIEVVNYQAFGGLSDAAGRFRSQRRAMDLKRMFVREFEEWPDFRCELESESLIRQTESYGVNARAIGRAFDHDAEFREDVLAQVNYNLAARVERLGPSVVRTKEEQLSRYVLGEIAFFEAVAEGWWEVYPGPNLFVRERLWRGDYDSLPQFARPCEKRRFRDVSVLAGGSRIPAGNRPEIRPPGKSLKGNRAGGLHAPVI